MVHIIEPPMHNDDHRREYRSPVRAPRFQARRLLEESFKDTENQVRTLVADLVEDMWAQRRRVIGIKLRIQQYAQRRRGLWITALALIEDQNTRRERNGR
jgi:hypothetical protein